MKEQLQRQSSRQFFSIPIDALAALALSIICISFSPIFIRLSDLELSPNATVFNRFWIAATAFLLVRRFFGNATQENSPRQLLTPLRVILLLADGIVLAAGLILWAWSLDHTTVAHSTLMHNLVPLFTVLGGWLVLNKTFDRRFLVGMAIAIAGAVLLEADSIASLSLNAEAIADLVALLSALFFGIHPLIIEQLRQRLDSLTIMTWSSVSSSLVLLPFTLLTTEGSLFPVSETGWLTVGALALIGQMLGVGLWTYCLKKLSSAFASLVALLIPSLSAIEGWLIFKEALDWLTLVSFIVVLFGMYLAISSQSSTTQTSKNPE